MQEFVHTAADGAGLQAYRWLPDGPPRGVVQVVHGASEHATRYDRVAGVLTGAGYAVVAHDQRGHGRTATQFGRLGVARPGGWTAMLADVVELGDRAADEHPGVPLMVLGHSMGAAVVQGALPGWADRLAGVVLSGPPQPPADPSLVPFLEEAAAGDAADQPSALFAGVFDGYNQPFAEALPAGGVANGFEWLSRDEAEVQAYLDDPLCGADVPLTNGFVVDMFRDGMAATAPERMALVPSGLPILLLAGDQDPVPGGGDGVAVLEAMYRELGLERVDVALYAGGRHEMLNEVNRDQVHADLLAWLDGVVGPA